MIRNRVSMVWDRVSAEAEKESVAGGKADGDTAVIKLAGVTQSRFPNGAPSERVRPLRERTLK
jgi:hypothetical protein